MGRATLATPGAPPVIEVVMAVRAASALEVVLVSGMRVAVPAGFDEATLRRLLTVLEGD